RRLRSEADPHLVSEAVEDTILAHLAKPERFDETRGSSLEAFLLACALRDLGHRMRSDQRRRRRGSLEGWPAPLLVEFGPSSGYSDREEVEGQPDLQDLMAMLPDPVDREVFRLRAAGEKRTARFAAVLGVAHLSREEQRRAVKQAKESVPQSAGAPQR